MNGEVMQHLFLGLYHYLPLGKRGKEKEIGSADATDMQVSATVLPTLNSSLYFLILMAKRLQDPLPPL